MGDHDRKLKKKDDHSRSRTVQKRSNERQRPLSISDQEDSMDSLLIKPPQPKISKTSDYKRRVQIVPDDGGKHGEGRPHYREERIVEYRSGSSSHSKSHHSHNLPNEHYNKKSLPSEIRYATSSGNRRGEKQKEVQKHPNENEERERRRGLQREAELRERLIQKTRILEEREQTREKMKRKDEEKTKTAEDLKAAAQREYDRMKRRVEMLKRQGKHSDSATLPTDHKASSSSLKPDKKTEKPGSVILRPEPEKKKAPVRSRPVAKMAREEDGILDLDTTPPTESDDDVTSCAETNESDGKSEGSSVEDRKQLAENHRHPADDRGQSAGDRKLLPDDRRQPVGDRKHSARDRKQPPGDRKQPADDRKQLVDDRRLPTNDNRQPLDDRRQPLDDRRQQADDRRQPAEDRRSSASVVERRQYDERSYDESSDSSESSSPSEDNTSSSASERNGGEEKKKLVPNGVESDVDEMEQQLRKHENEKRAMQQLHEKSPSPVVMTNQAVDMDIELAKDTLPLYYPATQGCRSVEEFTCLNRIEEGTYGVVYRAKDKRNDRIVALKRLKMEKEKEGFPITSLREINTLLKAQHVNVVHVQEIVVGSNMDKIFIVMDYVEHDMKSLMETMKQHKSTFTPGQVKCLMQQLISAVSHLHDNWILHRDLKTSNLLFSHQGILKVGDFGLAREYGSPLKNYTPVVVTLWYRAPELLLGAKPYSTPIDMWSVGCIFAEFLTMSPLFPGRSEIDQLNRIFKIMGTPNDTIWPSFSSLPIPQKVSFCDYPPVELEAKFVPSYLDETGFKLLKGLLTYDPQKRYPAEVALRDEYFLKTPLPVQPEMFPSWPAKSEPNAMRKKISSPKPPSGGQEYKEMNEDEGFFIANAEQSRHPLFKF